MSKEDLWKLVRTIRGPFTNKQLNDVCDMNKNTRRKYLQILCREKRVRRIRRGRFVVSSNQRNSGPGEEDQRILAEKGQCRQNRKNGRALSRCKRSLLQFYEEIFPYEGRTSEAAEAKKLNKDSARRDAQELVKDKLLERTDTGLFRALRGWRRITRCLLDGLKHDLKKNFRFKRRQIAYIPGEKYPHFVVVTKSSGNQTIAGDLWVVAARHRREFEAVEKRIIERIKTMTLLFIWNKITHYVPVLLSVGKYQPRDLDLESWQSNAGRLPIVAVLVNKEPRTAIDSRLAKDVARRVMQSLTKLA